MIFSFPCMSSSSSPVRPCKPLPAVKACSTMFHAQPDCTARKNTNFVYFEPAFVGFKDLHSLGLILRDAEQSNPTASMLLMGSYASICMQIHSTQRLSFYMCSYNFFLHVHYIYLHRSLCAVLSLSHPIL